eukprot:6172680-Pleurochrysis_carterae.AAC.1
MAGVDCGHCGKIEVEVVGKEWFENTRKVRLQTRHLRTSTDIMLSTPTRGSARGGRAMDIETGSADSCLADAERVGDTVDMTGG